MGRGGSVGIVRRGSDGKAAPIDLERVVRIPGDVEVDVGKIDIRVVPIGPEGTPREGMPHRGRHEVIVRCELMHVLAELIRLSIVTAAVRIPLVEQFPALDAGRVTPARLQIAPPLLLQPPSLGRISPVSVEIVVRFGPGELPVATDVVHDPLVLLQHDRPQVDAVLFGQLQHLVKGERVSLLEVLVMGHPGLRNHVGSVESASQILLNPDIVDVDLAAGGVLHDEIEQRQIVIVSRVESPLENLPSRFGIGDRLPVPRIGGSHDRADTRIGTRITQPTAVLDHEPEGRPGHPGARKGIFPKADANPVVRIPFDCRSSLLPADEHAGTQ